jgi:acyl-CoA reductase-like NAD-dependent aldehyde dehydrogenase
VAALLAACAARGRAVLFKPAPGAAVSGALLCRGVARMGWSGLSMVQGGAATGARLVALGGWGAVLVAGAAAVPAGLRGVAVLAPGLAVPG